jgi:hypothetical protein
MHVEFAFHGAVRDAVGRDRLERDFDLPGDPTVDDALAAVLREAPDAEPLAPNSKGTPRAHVALRHDGVDVRSGEWPEPPLAGGDRIEVEPSVTRAY